MKKLVRSSFLLLFLLLVWGAKQARAQTFCEPPACPAGGIIDISTGIDNRQGGVPLPFGQIDPHWQVTAGPTGPGAAFVFDTGNFGFAQQANWISFDTRGLTVPFTDEWYTFERCFCNCNEPIEIFDLEVIASHTIREVRIDNQVIYQNLNRPVPFSPPVDAFAPVPMPPWSTIGAGRFCIEIDVWAPQEDPVQTPLGLSVTGTVQGTGLQLDECCSAEPAAARIVGRKFHDQNCNGVWDAGEPPLAGWRFELFQNGNLTIPVSVTTSDANGNFVFPNLGLNNNYVVRERVDLQPGWRVTAPNANGEWAVTIGQFTDYEVDFGNCEEEPPNCCDEPEPVLVLSEDFEGTPLFFSEYQNGTAAVPGQYQLTNQVGAATLSNNRWDVQGFNLNNCNPSTEQFLLVNGRTGGTGEVIVYESPSVHNRLVDGQTYRVCVRVKHLPICAFDVIPQVQLELRRYEDDDHQLFNSQAIWQTPLAGVTSGADPCDYFTLTHEFTYRAPTGEDEEDFIGIRLDESTAGDGNDLAIDEFQLQEVTQVTQAAAGFTLHESDYRNGTYRVDAISTPIDSSCRGRWEICILDDPADVNSCRAGTSVSSPYGGQWGANTAFNGYCCTPNASATEARFDLAEVYFIRRYVECDCQEESEAYYKIWEKRSPLAPITILYDGPASDFPGSDDPIH